MSRRKAPRGGRLFSAAALALAAALAGGARPGPEPAASDPGEALREAAGAGDLVRVRALLDAGAPVDAGARHGQTALYFAADKGRLDVVRLLVERGADPNLRDRFFGSAPLTMALRGGHREVALYLLAHGASAADEALEAGVRSDDLELVRAALASGRVEPLDLLAARQAAEETIAKSGKGAEVAALLRAASVEKPRRTPYAPDAKRTKAYPARYRGPGGEAQVSLRGESLVVVLPGPEEIVLQPVAEDRYETAAGDVGVRFFGRAGMVEGLAINRGGKLSSYGMAAGDPAPLPTAELSAGEAASVRTAARPWPQFRGERAAGNGDGQGIPFEWNVKDGRNVRFKTALPGLSLSSPIVWGDRIFLTTAVGAKGDTSIRTGLYGDGDSVDDVSEHAFKLSALDKGTGRVVWDREVFRGVPTVRRHLKSSLANATPATDGRRVVVLFGTVGLLAAYDFEGREEWRREIGVLDCNDPQSGTAEWGHASSPVIWRDLVVVQGDRRKDSFLAAYHLADGRPAWRVARDEASTWATPNVVRGPQGDELVTNGRTIRAYDPRDGRMLWTLGPNSEVVVSTPQVGEGVVYVTAGYPPVRPVYAVRAGHRGDLRLPEGARSSPAVLWSHERGGTYIPSPLLYRGILYTLNNNGILTCYDAKDGTQTCQTRLGSGGSSFAASPVAADGRLLVASETGEVLVLRAGPRPELLGTSAMEEVTMATPALSDGLLVMRTAGHVFGLAEAPRAADRTRLRSGSRASGW